MHIYIWKERNDGANVAKIRIKNIYEKKKNIYESFAIFQQEWNYFKEKRFFNGRFLSPIP